MTRRGYLIFACGAVAVIGVTAIIHPPPRLIWNASASVPVGLYSVERQADYRRGDLLAVEPPDPLAGFLAARGYLPRGVPLLKRLVAVSGQRVCRHGARVTVDGTAIALAQGRDRLGRPLPVWQGCRLLGDGEMFLANPDVPDSLDGRYFGPLPASIVIGRASPLWVDPPAHPPSPPQPKES